MDETQKDTTAFIGTNIHNSIYKATHRLQRQLHRAIQTQQVAYSFDTHKIQAQAQVAMEDIVGEMQSKNIKEQYHNTDDGTMPVSKSCSTSSDVSFSNHIAAISLQSVCGNALSTSHRQNTQQHENPHADTTSSHGYQCPNSS